MLVLGTNWGNHTLYGLSTNLQEQSQNGLERATDVWQDWFRTFITQLTADNVVMWVTRLSIVDCVDSKTQTLLATLRIQNQLRESLMYLWKPNICPTGWMGKKQTSVSHSSTESEIMSLDAGLRMDGLALDLKKVVKKVVISTNNTTRTIRLAPGNWCGGQGTI